MSKRNNEFHDPIVFQTEGYINAQRKRTPAERSLQAMIDMLPEHDVSNEPLTGWKKRPTAKRPIHLPWELPPEAYLTPEQGEADYYLPGHFETDIAITGNTRIMLDAREQYLLGSTYPLGRTVVALRTPFSEETLTFHMGGLGTDCLDLDITTGRVGMGPPRAFLYAGSEDGKMYYFELEEFCVLAATDETTGSAEGIYTYFQKELGILITGFVSGDAGFKNARLSSAPYPKSPVPKTMTDRVEEHVRERFARLTGRYGKVVELRSKQKTPRSAQGPGGEIPLRLWNTDGNPLTQAQLREHIDIIRRRGTKCPDGEYTEINLGDMTQVWENRKMERCAMEIIVNPCDGADFFLSLHGDTGCDAAIIAGNPGGGHMAFLVVKREGKEHIVELESFSLLSVHHVRDDVHFGIVTVFSRIPNVLYIGFCEAYPDGKLVELDYYAKRKAAEPVSFEGSEC
jgi:hypothetical protein